jgi:Chromo (CHRromatin Organisation MOdifier) domain
VEQIHSHRTWGRRKTLQYLIKWKGYPESDNTWESADQVHAPDLIKLYHRNNTQKVIKARRVRLEGKHSPIISPPKAFCPSRSSSTILRDSTAALVWSPVHEQNTRSACNLLAPPVPYLSHPQAHDTAISSSVTSTGNPLILQTVTINSANSPSDQPPLVQTSSTHVFRRLLQCIKQVAQ